MSDDSRIEDTLDGFKNDMIAYAQRRSLETESLIAKYMAVTGLSVTDVCLVERQTPNGLVLYPDFKAKHLLKDNEGD